MVNRFCDVLLMGSESKFHYKKLPLNEEIFKEDKFWIQFNGTTKNIDMYDVATMKLHSILPFHYFKVENVKWNQEQSSFIALDKDRLHYSIIELVQTDTDNQ